MAREGFDVLVFKETGVIAVAYRYVDVEKEKQPDPRVYANSASLKTYPSEQGSSFTRMNRLSSGGTPTIPLRND
jgi:hypothetical protein